MKRLLWAPLVAIGLVLMPLGVAAERLPGAHHGGAPFHIALKSSVSGGAGSGTAALTINPGQQGVCWSIQVSGLSSPVIASHIHRGAAGTNGPVVVPFFATHSTATEFSGCANHNAINISTSERDLLAAIIANPSGYYVNVHTVDHPAGEVRGQLAGP